MKKARRLSLTMIRYLIGAGLAVPLFFLASFIGLLFAIVAGVMDLLEKTEEGIK